MFAIQADIADRKKTIAKQTGNIKSRQKEFQTAELEIREHPRDEDVKTLLTMIYVDLQNN